MHGGVPGVMEYGAVVRSLVPHRGMGPGASSTGPKPGIWEKQREKSGNGTLSPVMEH